MQQALAGWTASALSSQLNSKVEIGSINIGFLNRIIINDLTVHEPSGKKMLSVARVSASIDVSSLTSGRICVNTAQLFGTKATLYKFTPNSKPNYQFIIDAFASDEESEPSNIEFALNSFIMRHADISYDVKSEALTPGILDFNHIALHDCGMNLNLRHFANDSLNCTIRRLQAQELNSGLKLHDSHLSLVANAHEATISDLNISLPNSSLAVNQLCVNYTDYDKDGSFALQPTKIIVNLLPSDLAPIVSQFKSATQPLTLIVEAQGNHNTLDLPSVSVSTPNDELTLNANAQIYYPLSSDSLQINAQFNRLYVSSNQIHSLVESLNLDTQSFQPLLAAGSVEYVGNAIYSSSGIVSSGEFRTDAGIIAYDGNYDNEQFLQCSITATNMELGTLLANEQLGTTSFVTKFAGSLADIDKHAPTAMIESQIHDITYKNYTYHNIDVNANSTPHNVQGTLSVSDDNIALTSDFSYALGSAKDITLNLLLNHFNPHRLNLTTDYADESLSLTSDVHLFGSSFSTLLGDININDVHLATPTDIYTLDNINIHGQSEDNYSSYSIKSDIINGNINGQVAIGEIATSFVNQIAHHLPALVKPVPANNADFIYNLTVTDAPILHHFTDTDFNISKPITIQGTVNSSINEMDMRLFAPLLMYSGKEYQNLLVHSSSTTDELNFNTRVQSFTPADDEDEKDTNTRFNINSTVRRNRIYSDLHVDITGNTDINLHLLPIIQLSDSLGSLKTDIALMTSYAVINDTDWTVHPSTIQLYKNNIECNGVKFANNNNSYIAINGKASSNANDSLVATLNDIEIQYILSLTTFDAVRFAGKASGHATLRNVMSSGIPDVHANLHVANFTLQEGSMGDANIEAHWDKDIDGIALNARFVDLYETPDALKGWNRKMTGITTLTGWVSPAKNDMQLDVNTRNTNIAFLKGYLGGVFKDLNGSISGPISIIGPMNNIGIIGDPVANMNLSLWATGVPYHIEGDTVHLRPYLMDFKNITLHDKENRTAILNGKVTHRNLKNFAYSFNADLNEVCAYDEKQFNVDKFYATVYANGTLSIEGSDGHPLYVNADVTPTRGSVFAYDAATPDAITGNNFIEFFDRSKLASTQKLTANSDTVANSLTIEEKDSLAIEREARKNYRSDIYVNFNINLTPDCEVKLRMDNIDDGYMRTFGYATLSAKWYNKGTFQLFGNYNITDGSYRLYLQDIIFRDLTIQRGSEVVFDGNPFDADIHLICNHTIQSVPLSDLTSTTAFSQNNKVRVNCILDITGNLGNMDFKFDMDLPVVNEEVRQLVRSMINSEEEMNTQMIYLLGFGRFYPNEAARANSNYDNTNQAVNSLLSSTLSGQINQILSNMIGTNSNWNLGSTLATGERGWEDIDAEANVSGRLLDERLLINGNFGYRDNALTNQANFIGDFEVKWRITPTGNLYLKGYNQTNDRYFTKATLNTQGIGISWQHDFEWFRRKLRKDTNTKATKRKE